MKFRYMLTMLLAAFFASNYSEERVFSDAVDRLQTNKLQALHEAIATLRPQRQEVKLKTGFKDVRAIIHAHSAFSHDSRGTIDEILTGAKEAGVQVIMFSEHPSNKYNYFVDGHRGVRQGVLLIPGAETGGFLAYPRNDIQGRTTNSPQAFADLVRSTGGLIFLSHLEERMDWDIANLTGTEIYNTHADVKNETRFLKSLYSPLTMMSLANSIKQYPQEVFGAICDYPADYLQRYDHLCQKARQTGVAANDSHHNQVFRIKIIDGGALQLEDALGTIIAKLDPEKFLPVKLLTFGKKAGDIIFELDLDPYGRSFRHVSTHLLLTDLTESAVWNALSESRVFVSFDWLVDPTGFVYQAELGKRAWPIGSDAPFEAGLQLHAQSPYAGRFRLICDGKEVITSSGAEFLYSVPKAGVYRLEVWLKLTDEERPWILTNPIYVRGK